MWVSISGSLYEGSRRAWECFGGPGGSAGASEVLQDAAWNSLSESVPVPVVPNTKFRTTSSQHPIIFLGSNLSMNPHTNLLLVLLGGAVAGR